MHEKSWYVIILAGGNGERLWPLSRQLLPKQLLPFNDSSSLLAMTIDRITPLISKERRWVITTALQELPIMQAVGSTVNIVLAEPAARNTAAAVAWACLKLQQQNPEAVALFLSADHFIPDQNIFLNDLSKAAHYAQEHNTIALLGIQPTMPATGYGYIEYNTHDMHELHPVKSFHEKPTLEKAHEYLASGNMLWNTGMFCGKVSTFINEFELHAPHILAQVKAFMDGKAEYTSIEKTSFDYAVMEKSHATSVLPATFAWSDVGNLEVFLSLQGKTQDAVKNVYALESHNNLIQTSNSTKRIALIGVDDLCVIDTPDALLIAKRKDVEKVKGILELIRTAGDTEAL